MKVIKPSYEILSEFEGIEMLRDLEIAGRTCYKSEDKITDESAIAFVKMLIHERGHESVLEHKSVTVRIICDRGVSHEIVRHRIASYSQESTRYCNYSKDKFGNELTFIEPNFFHEDRMGNPSQLMSMWRVAMEASENMYLTMIRHGAKPEQARTVLPNSLKTEIVCTYNLREWRHFFKLRTSNKAHPQMREITVPMLYDFKHLIPVVFDDIDVTK